MPGAHGRKLEALFQNGKLPRCDKNREAEVMSRYNEWRSVLDDDTLPAEDYLRAIVDKTNEYKNFIDIDFIFKSEENFLYRQAGQ